MSKILVIAIGLIWAFALQASDEMPQLHPTREFALEEGLYSEFTQYNGHYYSVLTKADGGELIELNPADGVVTKTPLFSGKCLLATEGGYFTKVTSLTIGSKFYLPLCSAGIALIDLESKSGVIQGFGPGRSITSANLADGYVVLTTEQGEIMFMDQSLRTLGKTVKGPEGFRIYDLTVAGTEWYLLMYRKDYTSGTMLAVYDIATGNYRWVYGSTFQSKVKFDGQSLVTAYNFFGRAYFESRDIGTHYTQLSAMFANRSEPVFDCEPEAISLIEGKLFAVNMCYKDPNGSQLYYLLSEYAYK